jgi:hypothetical protein
LHNGGQTPFFGKEKAPVKRLCALAVLLLLFSQSPLYAQERGPLAMRIMFDWTAGGVVAGALVGAGIWLTDPGRPGNSLSEQMAAGAAWGAVAGAAFALSVINSAAIPPAVAEQPVDPLHPAMRISSDPIRQEERLQDLLASAPSRSVPGLVLPLVYYRF